MKNAPNRTKAIESATNQGAHIIAPGDFPVKPATVCAEVLARLLNGERLTSIDAVSEASTTRLAAVVHYLGESYRWNIQGDDKATGCRDGRVSWVKEYYLAPEAIANAMQAGAACWCAQVRTARRVLRTKAAQALREANRLNKLAKSKPQPGQWGLFDSDGGAV